MLATNRRTVEQHENAPLQLPPLPASDTGLGGAEAKKRLQQHGYNELPEKRVNPLLKFPSYFWGPIPWMIEIAAVLSLLVQHWADFWIITTLLVFNGLIGF